MSNFVRAVFIVLFAILMLDFQGVFVKLLGDRYPVPQIATFRNLFGLIPCLLILFVSRQWHANDRRLRLPQWPLIVIRAVSIATAQYCFYLSLTRMELATASTLVFAAPLFITALSVPVLGNRVGWMRWLAVIIGFSGIVIIMRPGSDLFQVAALLPVVSAFGYGLSSVLARKFTEHEPTALINLYTTLGTLTCSSLLMWYLGGYVPVQSVYDWGLLLGMGAVGGVAVFFLITAYRLTQPGNIAPFEYFGIPFSFALGYLFFDEAPFHRLMPGVLFIIGGGLLIFWRERQKHPVITEPGGPAP